MRLPTVFLLVVSCALGFEQESCYLSEEEEDQCASVCYPIVKPLLRYFEVCQTKDRTNAELQEKYSKVEEKYMTLLDKYSKVQDKYAEVLEKYSDSQDQHLKIQEELNKVSLENRDLQAKKDLEFEKQKAQIEQQSTRIIQLQDEISELKKSCELSELKNLFSEELEKLQKITKAGQEVIIEKENNDSNVNSVTKIEATNTTTSPSNSEAPIRDRCPATQDDYFSYPEIKIPGFEPFEVRCYSNEGIGAGWMEVYWKYKDSKDFNRTYEEYINGFGNVEAEIFMGLEKLHILTNWKPHEVRINYLGQCKTFVVGDKSEGYMVKKLDGCTGGTSYFNLIQGTKFSTYDRDEDGNPNHHWAKELGYGWWFSSEKLFNPTGLLTLQIRRKD